MNVTAVLVGAPGSGKSTVGAALAEALGCSFRDTDADIAQSAAMSIQDIFITEGEAGFRDRERAAVLDCADGARGCARRRRRRSGVR